MPLSRTEALIIETQQRLTELEVRRAAEEKAAASDSAPMRALAVALHKALCTSPTHAEAAQAGCTWAAQNFSPADDARAADWTEPSHGEWLRIARAGVATLRALGWTVNAPA